MLVCDLIHAYLPMVIAILDALLVAQWSHKDQESVLWWVRRKAECCDIAGCLNDSESNFWCLSDHGISVKVSAREGGGRCDNDHQRVFHARQ